MKKLKYYLFVFVGISVGVGLMVACVYLEKQEKAEEKQAMIEQAAEDKKEEEIQQKQLEVVSAHLKLPEDNVMMVNSYDNDFGDYDEGEIYSVIAKGVEYEASFNQAITKVDKFVQMPSDESEYCSDSSTDSDSNSTHFPKIKKSSSKRK